MTERAPAPTAVPTTAEEAAELAARHGLRRVDEQPGLGTYLRQLWRHRAFVVELASANAYSRNQNNYLGQLWAAINPLLLAGTYYLIFGLLIGTREGTDNYVGFLTTGIFIFTFFSATLTAGARSITGNQGLVRALRFPRVALPVSITTAEFIVLLPAMAVLLVVVVLTGERPSVEWLMLVPALLLLYAFCAGAAMIAARLVTESRDLLNMIPMGVRLLRYVSGVFFSIATYGAAHGTIGLVLLYQPVAAFLNLVRSCILHETVQTPELWAVCAGWAVLFLGVGIFVFWRAERRYGRD